MKVFKVIAAAILLGLVGLGVMFGSTTARQMVLSHGVSPETQGYEIAVAQGCFQCHGSWGRGGVPNPGAGSIPALIDFAFLMEVHSQEELVEWIMDGAPARTNESQSSAASRAVRMPAYGDRISESELAGLLDFYHGVAGTKWPDDPLAEKGYKTAQRLGCFSCHGLAGRFDTPNPGSLVGRIPAWNGPDFEELAKDEDEIREWILDGIPQRLANHPVAAHFIQGQLLKMPAYRDLISDEELDELLAYINWVRNPDAPGQTPDFSGGEGSGGSRFPGRDMEW